MTDDRPAWARRMAAERQARNWSQRDAVRALRAHAPTELPGEDSMIRQWKRWEYTKLIVACYDQKSHGSPIVQNGIIRYALTCPLPEAYQRI